MCFWIKCYSCYKSNVINPAAAAAHGWDRLTYHNYVLTAYHVSYAYHT
jgi:hypothetical protein